MIVVPIFGFTEKIKWYLDTLAEKDEAFKAKYENTEKTIDGCCKRITNYVRESIHAVRENGMSCGGVQIDDDTVYQLAVQYFVDDTIVEEKPKPKAEPKPKADKPTDGAGKKKLSDKFKKKEEPKTDKPTASAEPKPKTEPKPKADNPTASAKGNKAGKKKPQQMMQLFLFE